MIKKSIIAIVAIIAAAGLVFAAYGDNNSTNSNDLEKQQNDSANTDNVKSSSNTSTSTAITAAKAQEIAQKYIEEPGATAGKPKLTSVNGNKVYIVPVMLNGEQVGEIEIDAQTGKNLGGAGGAP